MKKKNYLACVLGFLLASLMLMTLMVYAFEDHPLDTSAMNYWHATRESIIRFSDLTATNLSTNSSTAYVTNTITNYTMAVKTLVYPTAMVLEKTFIPTGTNYFSNTTVQVGTTDSTNLFFGTMQINGNHGTPVYIMGPNTNQFLPAGTTNMLVKFCIQSNYPANIFTQGVLHIYYKVLEAANAK